MLSVYQAEGNNKCKEQMYNESRMYTASLFPVNVFQLALKKKNYKGFSIIFPKILAAI